MIIQLNPPIPVTTIGGKALAHFLIDNGIENEILWVCFLDSNGECWTYRNQEIRSQLNLTHGRNHVSPFYDPKDVSLRKELNTTIHLRCHQCGFFDLVNIDHAKDWVCPYCLDKDYEKVKSEIEKQIEEEKIISETPNLQGLSKQNPSIIDEPFQEKIAKVCKELRGNEIKILDDFCKAYYAAESKMTGKDFMTIVGEVALNIQTFFKDGECGTRYWFSPKSEK